MATKSPVASLNTHLLPITADELIAESMQHRTGPGPGVSLKELISALPETSTVVLDQILDVFDYRGNKKAPLAIACRMLAAVSGSLASNSMSISEEDQLTHYFRHTLPQYQPTLLHMAETAFLASQAVVKKQSRSSGQG